MADQNGDHGENAQCDREKDDLAGCLLSLFMLSCAKHPCSEGASPHSCSNANGAENHLDRKTYRQGGEGLGTEPGKPESVDQVGNCHGEHRRDGRPAHFQE